MFFNEDLSFFNEDEELSTATVTESEIEAANDAVEQEADALGVEPEAITESAATDALVARVLLEGTEYYYNLRERMMNAEHVAAMKYKDGLYSESAMLLEASWGNFTDKVKEFFRKLKNLIKNLWNKFLNFINSLTVRAADVLNLTSYKDAWDAYTKRMKDSGMKIDKVKVRAYDVTKDEAMRIFDQAKKLTSTVEDLTDEMKTNFRGLKQFNGGPDGELTAGEQNNIDEYKKLYAVADRFRDRQKASQAKIDEVFGNILNGGGTIQGEKQRGAVAKSEKVLDYKLFEGSVNYAKAYKTITNETAGLKGKAEKLIDDAIKEIRDEKDLSLVQKKLQSTFINSLRWSGNTEVKIFSACTSFLKSYYNQSMAIAKRVIGAMKAKERKENFESMTSESAYLSSYFGY